MILHLIRHGTTATSGSTYAGRSDVPLNAEGRDMAERVARDLSLQPIGLIVSSPLGRARDTALPLARSLGLSVRTDPLLMELDYGVYEGRPKKALGLALRKTHATTPVPGGEALIDVWRRAAGFLEPLTRDTGIGQIAVVGHFWINRMIYGQVKGLDFDATCRARDYRPRTGSVVTLQWPPTSGAGR